MGVLGVLAKIHRALDFLQGHKTRIGAALVLLGKAVQLWDESMGTAIENVGLFIAGLGLTVAATRPAANAIG